NRALHPRPLPLELRFPLVEVTLIYTPAEPPRARHTFTMRAYRTIPRQHVGTRSCYDDEAHRRERHEVRQQREPHVLQPPHLALLTCPTPTARRTAPRARGAPTIDNRTGWHDRPPSVAAPHSCAHP